MSSNGRAYSKLSKLSMQARDGFLKTWGSKGLLGRRSRAFACAWSTGFVLVLVGHWHIIIVHLLDFFIFLFFFFFSGASHLLHSGCFHFFSKSGDVIIRHQFGWTWHGSLHAWSVFSSGAVSASASAISKQKFSVMAHTTSQALSRRRSRVILPGVGVNGKVNRSL